MWQYMEFCGYVGMALFFAAAVLIFWKMRVYDSFLYFLKERQRKRRQRKRKKKAKTSGMAAGMMLGILCMMAAAVYANTELAPDGEVKIEAAELAQAEKTKTAAVELARVEETKTAAVELARAEETKTAAVELAQAEGTKTAAVELAQAEGTKTEETELKQTEETQTGAIELKQTEEIQTGKIALFPVGQSHVWEDVRYYDEGVDGVIEVPADWSETWREEGLAGSKISLQAIPEDETARESAREAEGADYTYQDGICEIKNWEIREETNTSKVTFRFQLQGKWKLRFSGEREEEIQPEYPGESEEVAGETGEAPGEDEEISGETGGTSGKGEENFGGAGKRSGGDEENAGGAGERPGEDEENSDGAGERSGESEESTDETGGSGGSTEIPQPETVVKKIKFLAASEVFVTDREQPELEVTYENCQNISNAWSSSDAVNRVIERGQSRILSSDYEVSASGKGQVSIRIEEDYFVPEKAKVRVFEEKYEGGDRKNVTEEFKNYERNGGVWKKEGNVFTLKYEWEREGHFQFQVEYSDPAGHVLRAEKDSETENCLVKGEYEGPLYTIDNTAPVLRDFSYRRKSEQTAGERDYFREKPVIVVEIEEENFNQTDFSLRDVMTWADGSRVRPVCNEEDYVIVWNCSYENGRRINKAMITVEEEANHTLSGWVRDICGQGSTVQMAECTYDTTPPSVQIRVWGEEYFIPYKTYQYFGREPFTVSVTAKDKISGVQTISCRYHGEKAPETDGAPVLYENENIKEKSGDLSEYQVEFSVLQEDFKGKISVQAADLTGWKSEEASSPGLLLTSQAVHQRSSSISLKVSEADYTDEEKKVKYYRHPVMVTAKAQDSHAGVSQLTLSVYGQEQKEKESEERKGSGAGGKNVNAEERKSLTEKKRASAEQDILYEEEVSLRIQTDSFQGSSAENPLEIMAELRDNAGCLSSKWYEEYRIVTDSEKPKIQVAYDTSDSKNGMYYGHGRTATVTVWDRNFNPDAVRWDISGSNQKYQIGNWTREKEKYQCQVRFDEDGKNYRIKVTVEDYAGNQSVWNEDRPFTIDKTPPVVEMKMDITQASNGMYYRKPQEVTFLVQDKNLDISTAALCFENDGRQGKPLHLSQTEKDQYSASIIYKEDGEYRVWFQCTDLAGNVSRTEKELRFVIDRTDPVLQVEGVGDKMSYSGEVRPAVAIADNNLDRQAVFVQIEKTGTGESAESVWKPSVRNRRWGDSQGTGEKNVAFGKQFAWNTLPRREEMDGIYRLQAYARDLAGNQVSLGKGITFTVNRFGSVYTLQERLRAILETGYMRQEEGIVITEYSVNPVDTRITILKDNQNWRELHMEYALPDSAKRKNSFSREQKTGDGRYAVLSDKVTSGNKKGWYVKRHYISGENFKEEGTYQITLDSVGYVMEGGVRKIIKETSSTLRGAPIFFTVDKTPPVVQIGGLEKEFYEGETHPFVITVMDNCDFAYMDMEIWQEGGSESQRLIRILPEDLKSNHSVVKKLKASEEPQLIRYRAWDKAGNCLDSEKTGEEIRCVVLKEGTRQEGKEEAIGKSAAESNGIWTKANAWGEDIWKKNGENPMRWSWLAVLAAAAVAGLCIPAAMKSYRSHNEQ